MFSVDTYTALFLRATENVFKKLIVLQNHLKL